MNLFLRNLDFLFNFIFISFYPLLNFMIFVVCFSLFRFLTNGEMDLAGR